MGQISLQIQESVAGWFWKIQQFKGNNHVGLHAMAWFSSNHGASPHRQIWKTVIRLDFN